MATYFLFCTALMAIFFSGCKTASTVNFKKIISRSLILDIDTFSTESRPLAMLSNINISSTTGKPDEGYNLNPYIGNNSACTLKDGTEGVCVLHYQCDKKTQTAIEDGATLIDIRQRDCHDSLEVCCRKNLTKKDDGGMLSDEPNIECGWGNRGAIAYWRIDEDRADVESADFGEYPWMVALLKKSEAGATWSQGDFLGGGSIIHPSVVLTAAHKVEKYEANQLRCRAGEWDTQTDREVYPHQDRDVRKKIVHEDYFRPSLLYNVALLILDKPYELDQAPHMGIACVAAQPPPPDTKCQTMGWGKRLTNSRTYVNILKKVELSVRSRNSCQNALRGTRLGSHFQLHTSLTCAGGDRGVDTCTGDGGSSLVCPIGKETGRYAIFGMAAYGIGCGEEGVPGVYVNVPHVRRWIDAKMEEESYPVSSYTDPEIVELRP